MQQGFKTANVRDASGRIETMYEAPINARNNRLETLDITCVDEATGLDGTYFIIHDLAGSVAVWIDVDNSGTPEPAHGAQDQ